MRTFSQPALGAIPHFSSDFKNKSIFMHRRPRQNHRAPTIIVEPPQFSALGGLELWKPPKKLAQWVVLTPKCPTASSKSKIYIYKVNEIFVIIIFWKMKRENHPLRFCNFVTIRVIDNNPNDITMS